MNTHSEIISDAAMNPVEKKRGTIIIDASILLKLAADVPSQFLYDLGNDAPSISLLETLTFLGANGYDIVIPEMVAFEVADVLGDCRSIARYFPQSTRKPAA